MYAIAVCTPKHNCNTYCVSVCHTCMQYRHKCINIALTLKTLVTIWHIIGTFWVLLGCGSEMLHFLAFIYILLYHWLLGIIMQKVPWGLILLLIAPINLIHLRLRQNMSHSMMTSNTQERDI